MPYDNNVRIGSAGTCNTFNISQHHASETRYVEYSVVPDSIEHVSRSAVNRGATIFVISVLLPVIGLFADTLGILSFLGLQSKWPLLIPLVFIAIIGYFLTRTELKLATTEFDSNKALFIGGKWFERGDDGKYVAYRKAAAVPEQFIYCRHHRGSSQITHSSESAT